ncbi:response regulator transcription factor [Leisingera daeponensis]|uniref:response regulator transcription factor n=1 Tax=Leisingera daeponensis TaxID=405746 RepID=UPI001C966B78|nr:helix-turn-helix transcriptional regulator [Leisingera daeponensis]MBY6058752.1 helix-turn-helix transcriptional regulator [Leisingera daeponensis]
MDSQIVTRSTEALGTPDFYQVLLEAYCDLISADAGQVIAYRKKGQPDYLAAVETTKQVQKLYRGSFYRECPMHHHWLTRRPEPIVFLQEAQIADYSYENYFREFYAVTGLRDEIGLFLPTSRNVQIALFLERKVPFQTRDGEWAFRDYPGIVGLHKANLRLNFAEILNNSFVKKCVDTPLAILDRFGFIVICNGSWKENNLEEPLSVSDILGEVHEYKTDRRNRSDYEFKVVQLGPNNPITPDGFAVMAVKTTATKQRKRWQQRAMDEFQPFALTPRENDVLENILSGKDNALIAKRLAVSINAIKGHRKRIYAKLDITSERELLLYALKNAD